MNVSIRHTWMTTGAVLLLSFALLTPNMASAQTPPEVTPDSPTNLEGPPRAQSTETNPGAQNFGSHTTGEDIYGPLGYWLISFFAWITGVAGIFLNAVVYYTVIKMGDFVNSMPSILLAWKILRDLGNIALIFGFVAIGVATILDVESYNAKKMLVKLILVAVTVNFSLFAARAIIDVGNVFAYQFYTEMNRVTHVTVDSNFWSPENKGVSDAIMQMVGLQKFYESDAITQIQASSLDANWPFALIFGSLLFIVATFVMLAFAFMLIARFVVLVLLMILAPVGFVGYVIPTMEGRAKQWWSTLISQTLTAPLVLLMLLISVSIMSTPGILIGATNTRDVGALLNPGGASPGDWSSSASLIIGFFIAMGFLMASLILAKQMGAAGASFSIGMSRRLTGFALSPISRPARAGGSAFGRWGANKVGSGLGGAYDRVANATGIRGTMFGRVVDDSIATSLKKVRDAKIDGKSFADKKKEREHRDHDLHKVEREQRIEAIGRDANRTDQEKEQEIAAILRGMSQKEIEELALAKKSSDSLAFIAQGLSPDRFKAIINNNDVDSTVRDNLRARRYASIDADLQTIARTPAVGATQQQTQARDAARARLRQWSAQDLAMSGMSGDNRLLREISQTQYEETLKRDELPNQAKQAMRTERRAVLSGPNGHSILLSMNRKDLAKQDADLLADPNFYSQIDDPQVFGQMQLDSNLSVQQRNQIGTRIRGIVNNPNHPQNAAFRAYIQGTPGAKAYWNIS